MTDSTAAKVARERPVIAIDGPAGAGKSTLAAHLARRFGFLNLETGAMYRALALKAIENDQPFDDESALMELAQYTRVALEPQAEGNRVFWMAWMFRGGCGSGRDRGGFKGVGASAVACVDGQQQRKLGEKAGW